jgi:hypothetical protein
MKTRAVNLRTEPYDVYIGRAGHGEIGYFGNPFGLTTKTDRERSLALYAKYFASRLTQDAKFARVVLSLRGARLGCFCKPKRCHGDIMAKWIDSAVCSCGKPAVDARLLRDKVVLLCERCAK